MGYEYIDHTADLSIRVFAKDLPSLYAEAGLALADILGARVKDEASATEVSLSGIDRVDLLVRWLQELLYLMEVKGLRIGGIEIVSLTDTGLQARVCGAHREGSLTREIKAVTYHNLDIREVDNIFEAAIIFDT